MNVIRRNFFWLSAIVLASGSQAIAHNPPPGIVTPGPDLPPAGVYLSRTTSMQPMVEPRSGSCSKRSNISPSPTKVRPTIHHNVVVPPVPPAALASIIISSPGWTPW